jgi:5-methylcytosine-specific restriction endonuclease McrA
MTWIWVIIVLLIISELQHEPQEVVKKPKSKAKEFYSSSAWRNLRYKVLCHYEATCMCCGASKESGDQIHVDHVLPRSLYPEQALNFDNMQVLCGICNLAKSNTDFTDWRQPVRG